jgi:hypothetical protein
MIDLLIHEPCNGPGFRSRPGGDGDSSLETMGPEGKLKKLDSRGAICSEIPTTSPSTCNMRVRGEWQTGTAGLQSRVVPQLAAEPDPA